MFTLTISLWARQLETERSVWISHRDALRPASHLAYLLSVYLPIWVLAPSVLLLDINSSPAGVLLLMGCSLLGEHPLHWSASGLS
ncbi:hypothetical protein Acr_10g0007020 [Actinidia rufa]|uniref:Uncharacterized protein n=1 Tax=Actinidia rufa TaxID=165716 RepID=A0A7J0FBQ8_9ERIC|nr:hypothetical protein Acr_10g0007020 [Actinidia rufa]